MSKGRRQFRMTPIEDESGDDGDPPDDVDSEFGDENEDRNVEKADSNEQEDEEEDSRGVGDSGQAPQRTSEANMGA